MVNENGAFKLDMLTGRLWVNIKEQSSGDTDVGFIHKKDIFEVIHIEDVFTIESIEKRALDRGFFMKEVFPVIQMIQVSFFLNNGLYFKIF